MGGKDGNIFTLLYDLFFAMLNVASELWKFLFDTHKIGVQMFKIGGEYLIDFSLKLNLSMIILGGGFIAFIILYLVKQFIPVA